MSGRRIAVAGAPAWLPALQARVNVTALPTGPGFVPRLTDLGPALLLLDASDEAGRRWISAARANNATRRIPTLAVADEGQHSAALLAGADHALRAEELLAAPEAILRQHARPPDPERQARLACECGAALPPAAREGVRLFNAGEYYAQHDVFEALWVETEGPVRELYRAVLQVGVALYQAQRGNRRGALKMLLRSAQWLRDLPDVCQGLDVAQLRADVRRLRAELSEEDGEVTAFSLREVGDG
ncbi:MAG: DUF309 domain-containing protein [Anaerolineaceae bacterium]|nr:DUF309 domain-containing protein [Anaerolineaceae bacterium]